MADGYGYEAEDDDDRLAAAIQTDTARIGQLDPYQAYRAGFYMGGNIARENLRGMIADGLTLEQAIAGLRDFWEHQIHPWADRPTFPGQEILPEIDLWRRRDE